MDIDAGDHLTEFAQGRDLSAVTLASPIVDPRRQPAILTASPSDAPACPGRDQPLLDERIESVEIDIGQDRGNHAPNAMGNFEFDVTVSYRRLERPRRVTNEV